MLRFRYFKKSEISYEFIMEKIIHDWNNTTIIQLKADTVFSKHLVKAGHVNATQMCVSCGKKFNDYARLESTKAYWEGLAAETGFPVSVLVVSIKGGNDKDAQGTWVHPEIAIDLAQWVSVDFRIWANRTLRNVIETRSIIQPVTSLTQVTPKSLIDLYSQILAPTNLDNSLKATYLFRALEAQFPEISPSIQKMLPLVQKTSDEEYVSPTSLAQAWNKEHGTNIKAYQMNNALEAAGYQISFYVERTSTKTGKLKREKTYNPTEPGKKYSIFMLDKAGNDRTVQSLRWKYSVLKEISSQLKQTIK